MSTADWCPTPETPPSKDPAEVTSTVDLSFLCDNGWQPLLITGFLRDLLIRQSADKTNISSPELQQERGYAESYSPIGEHMAQGVIEK